ncbi:MAG: ATP-binding protein, partial [Proteobacteria bacterium]|nr:ATP-binding protein [Pseudomonadota bacterium]
DLKKDDSVRIAIHNAGAIPEEIRDTFFDKYVTFDKMGGTGLGTYSAKLMVETIGGGIGLETSAKDGTTITVTLPINGLLKTDNDTEEVSNAKR